MTLDDMAGFLGVTRRTAERKRDAIELACGLLDQIEDGKKVRFRMNGAGIGRFATAPTAQEMAEVETIALASEAVGDTVRAETLRSLKRKIQASLREGARQTLKRDVEAQLRAEAFARQVGPPPYADAETLTALREALLASRVVTFRYRADHKGPARKRKVVPYGLLIGPYYYLVARTGEHAEPALFRLADVVVTEEGGALPKDFDLKAYAERSFGVFQEEPDDVVLRFDASAAQDARAYVFHPTQTLTDQADGSLTVRFRAGGLVQIANHLMTWGPTVNIVAPDRLKETMRAKVEALHGQFCRSDALASADRRAPVRGPGRPSPFRAFSTACGAISPFPSRPRRPGGNHGPVDNLRPILS